MAGAKNETAMSGKQFWLVVGTLSTVLAAGVAVHAYVVPPMIRDVVRKDIRDEIDTHESRPHQGAVSHRELDLLRDDIRAMEKKLDAILLRLQ